MGVDKSPTDTYPMRVLRAGDTITPTSMDYAVTVLACWLIRPSDVDAYAWWLVLCHQPHNSLHPYAVWDAYDRPDGWSLNNGDYCENIGRGVHCYEKRGGKYEL
jgi:hypothetical protein